nr:condensation domain-containing protein [uncultured bacterium]
MDGPLDVAALERAVKEVVRRHEVLRTTFRAVDGMPVQVVAPSAEVPFEVVDLRALAPGPRGEEARRRAAEEVRRPFDLARGPLVRAVVVWLEDHRQVLMVSMHHIVSDGWSVGVLRRELGLLYRAFATAQPSPLAELPVQYADFALWQRRWLASGVREAQLRYWRQALAGAPATLECRPTAPPAGAELRGSPRAWPRRRAHRGPAGPARAEGATLFMVLLGAFSVLLGRPAGRDDVVVGTPSPTAPAPRSRGWWAFNTPVLHRPVGRPQLPPPPGRVREAATGAYAHQDLPFEEVVRELAPRRQLSHMPLFQVMFTLLTSQRRTDGAPATGSGSGSVSGFTEPDPGPDVDPYEIDSATAKFDLTLSVEDRGPRLTASLEYRTDLFTPETATRMLSRLVVLLERVAHEPDTVVSRLPLVAEAEARDLRAWSTGPALARPSLDAAGLVEAQARLRPDGVAAVEGDRRLTYAELDRRADGLAARLGLGAGAETTVALWLDRGLEAVVAMLATLKAGGAYLPLDPAHPAARLRRLWRDSRAGVLVTARRFRPDLPPEAGAVVYVDDESPSGLGGQRAACAARRPDPDAAAYAIYTSGSTGEPKGVVVPQRALVNLALAAVERYRLSPDDRVLQFASVSFDVAAEEVLGTWAAGGTVVIGPEEVRSSFRALERCVKEEGITVLNLPVPYWHEWVSSLDRAPRALPPTIRLVIVGSERGRLDRLASWGARAPEGVRLLNAYGTTETTITSAVYEPPAFEMAWAASSIPIGRPLANTELYVLDRHREPVPVGVVGELYIGGEGLARGYLNRPELTAERFVAHPFRPGARLYRSGDLARYLPDGNLELVGRADHQVKIRGFRVEPGEVEAALVATPGVREAAVMARHDGPDGGGGGARWPTWCPTSSRARRSGSCAATGPRAARLHAARSLRGPRHLPSPPTAARPGRPACAGAGPPRLEEAFVAPRSATEETLARIWAEVLDVEQVGVEDNFFELGGDSIMSIQILARANQAGLGLQLADLFRHQTVAELALAAAPATAAGAGRTSPESGAPTGPVPLTPIQRWFVEQELVDWHHYNQAVLLEPPDDAEPDLVRQVVQHLVDRHDALRLRFAKAAHGWEQEVLEAGREVPFEIANLHSPSATDQPWALARAVDALQAGLRPAEGRVVAAGWFDMGRGRGRRLLLVIHHLAVDGVSWRILREELETAYNQLRRGEPAVLPPTTTPFRTWAERLARLPVTPLLDEDVAYWSGLEAAAVSPLPVDRPDGRSHNTVGSLRTVRTALSRADTARLLHDAPAAYGTEINDVLLTALAQALTAWTGAAAALVDLEGHGREPIVADLDPSGTVGWFTTLFPVLLKVDPGRTPMDTLRSVRRQLTAIPKRGIGYGILRYLAPDGKGAVAPSALPAAEVCWNYLGQFGGGRQGRKAQFHTAPEPVGSTRSDRQAHPYLLEVNAWVSDGQLHLRWTYSRRLYRDSTVEDVASRFLNHLRAVLPADERPTAHRPTAHRPTAPRSPPSPSAAAYPLSPMQQGMLFHTLLSPGSGEYVESGTWPLRGAVAMGAYRRAWEQVVARHDVFRTEFVWQGVAEPRQRVKRKVSLPWAEHDWRNLTAAEREDQLHALVAEDRGRGFDLSHAPLMRVSVVRCADDLYRVVWTHHHLVLDGWSVPLVLNEVAARYQALTEGTELHLDPPRPYRDYIAWLGQRDQPGDLRFWRRALEGFSAPTSLRCGPRGDGGQDAYEAQELGVTAETTRRLRAMARSHRLTLSTVLRGAWALLLARYSGEEDVVFGAVVSGRPAELAGVEQMVGLFVNTIPVRARVTPERPVLEWLRRLQSDAVAARPHEHCSLAEVQRASDVPAGTPLFETLLIVENYPRPGGASVAHAAPGIRKFRPLETANYPLTMVARPGDELSLRVIYRPDRFSDAVVARLLLHLRRLLEGMVAEPDQPLGALPLLGEDERHRALVEWNDTATDFPRTSITAQFEAQVDARPDTVAIVFGDEHLTYAALDRRANRLANHLRALGVGAQDLVGVFGERSLDAVVALLGILKAGAAYVPLDPTYPPERLQLMLDDTAMAAVVSPRHLVDQLPGRRPRVVSLDDEEEWREGTERPGPVSGPDDVAYVMYTSGSTGRPKGILIPHRAVLRLVLATNYISLGPEDRVAFASNFSFDATTFEIWGALLCGGRLVGIPGAVLLSAEALASHLRVHGITALFLTTSLFNQVARHDPGAFQSLTHLLVGGEAADPRWFRAVLEHGPPGRLLNVYGPTETTTFASWFPVDALSAEASSIPIGRPLANTELYVLDRHREPVPVGVVGELYIGGEGLARGYLNRPELTAERFVAHPFRPGARLYRSGDLARHLPDGNLELVGRADHQVKIRGFRVEPGEVEAALVATPGVREAAVMARHDGPEGGGERRLVAYVVPHEPPGPAVGELRRHLARVLPDYMLPAAFVVLDTLPLTPNGKLDRAALPAPERARPRLEEAFVAPRSATEETLARIWAEVLDVEQVGVEDNFFELGGHSLLATQVVSRIRDALHAEVPLRNLFEAPSVAEMARAVERSTTGPQPAAGVDAAVTAVPRDPFRAQLVVDVLDVPDALRDRLRELA